MQEFLTGDIWGKMNKIVKLAKNRLVCIAYVTTDTIKLCSGDTLICDASDYAIQCGETSAGILDSYFKKGVVIYSNSQLHSKLLLTEDLLVVGSANLSNNSAKWLVESAILTQQKALIAQGRAFTYNLVKESTLLDKGAIDRLLAIKVIRRKSKPRKRSSTRELKFGDRHWFVPLHPLSERVYGKISDTVEAKTETIASREGIDFENIGFIRWNANTEFSKNIQPGEQIVIKFTNKGKTRSHIYPPVTVLEKELADNHIHLYYDAADTENKKIAWSQFRIFAKDLNLNKQYNNRVKIIDGKDLDNMLSVFHR